MKIAVWRHLEGQKLSTEYLFRLWKDNATENGIEFFLDEDSNNIYQRYWEGTEDGFREQWYLLQR